MESLNATSDRDYQEYFHPCELCRICGNFCDVISVVVVSYDVTENNTLQGLPLLRISNVYIVQINIYIYTHTNTHISIHSPMHLLLLYFVNVLYVRLFRISVSAGSH